MLDELIVGLISVLWVFCEHTINDVGGLAGDIGSEGLQADGLAFKLFEGDH